MGKITHLAASGAEAGSSDHVLDNSCRTTHANSGEHGVGAGAPKVAGSMPVGLHLRKTHKTTRQTVREESGDKQKGERVVDAA